jgi:hypothetical protein
VVAVALAGTSLVLVGRDSSLRGVEAGALPEPVAPAFRIPEPTALRPSPDRTRWSEVVRRANARARPSWHAPVIARLGTRTPEGTANVVLVLRSVTDEAGRVWVRARLPVLPNGTTGWIRREALGGYHVVHTHLIVDLSRLTATLVRGGRPIFRAPVGVGEAQWPTPTGQFYVRNRLTTLDGTFYGPLAFGTSARSAVLTDWPAGGFIGIHGTSEPSLLPGRVSHGCIRMRNDDILRLGRLMPVGTAVTIH